MSTVTRTCTEAPASGLRHSLSGPQITMLALGSALGTGLFLGSGAAIGVAGPAVAISFAIGSILAAIIVAAMGEMGTLRPVPGGFGTLAGRYLGRYFGYLTRWSYWLVTVTVTGAELVAVAHYLTYWLPDLPLWAGITASAVLIIVINLISVGSFGSVEWVLSMIKVTAVVVFIVLGAVLIFVDLPGQPATGLGNLTAHGGFLPNGPGSIWIAMSIVVFSFGGIELISIAAAEAHNPARAVAVAAKTSMIRLASFYVLSILVVVAIIPWTTASAAGNDVSASPFVLVFQRLGIPAAAAITNAIVLIAALSAANANLYASSRMVHSLASDGLAPAPLAAVSGQGVPRRAIAASTLGIIAAATLAATGISNLFVILISVVVFCVLVVWALILVTYLAYRRDEAERPPFQMWGGTRTAWVGLGVLLFVASTIAVVPDMQLAAAVGIPFLGALTLVYWWRLR